MAIVRGVYGPGTSATGATAYERTSHHTMLNYSGSIPEATRYSTIISQPEPVVLTGMDTSSSFFFVA